MKLGIDIGLKNFAYCLLDDNNEIVEWEVLDLTEPFKEREHYKGKFDMIHISLKLNELFRNLVERYGREWVVNVENQIPRGTNGITMKSIQGMVTQQLISLGIDDVVYVCGSSKLKQYDVPKKTYRERKKSSIAVVRAILKGEMPTKHKMDDMCDAYLLSLVSR